MERWGRRPQWPWAAPGSSPAGCFAGPSQGRSRCRSQPRLPGDEYERAIADHTKAIALDPNDANAYYNRGVAYEQKGDKDQAIADFRKVLEINPSDQDAKVTLELLGVTP